MLLVILLSVIFGLILYVHQLKATIEQLKFKCMFNKVFYNDLLIIEDVRNKKMIIRGNV